MRKYIVFLLSLLLCFQVSFAFPVYGADQKISELTALGAKPASDDTLVIYDSSTGLTKKVDYTYLEDIKNVNLYGGLTAAVASIGATETTLLITDAQTVTADLSIPTTMQLFVARGGDITVSAGKVLTINGTILAGAYQIFGSTGTVTYAGNGIFYGKWKSGGSNTVLVDNKDAVMANLLTGQGDIIYSSSSTVPARLVKGAANTKLFINAGATAPEWAVGVQIGVFSIDTATATGTQAVTGVGFKPAKVFFIANVTDTTQLSFGFDDGTIEDALYNNYARVATQWAVYTASSIYLIQDDGILYSGLIQSLDADGFTISWTKAGAKTGTASILYLAIR
ncbi:hypothetical protein ES708_04641 [subsurface metagenome]